MSDFVVSKEASVAARSPSRAAFGSAPLAWWLAPNLLALDAPVVAVVWLHAFARAFATPVEWPVTVALFAAVWSIYLADRLIDTRHQQDLISATARHRFARRHQKGLLAAMVMSLVVGGWLAATRLEVGLLRGGMILAGAVALYFGGFVRLFKGWRPLPAKEVVCGFVFAVGCALGVAGVRGDWMNALPAVALFGGLCAFNCLAISAWEKGADRVNDCAAASRWWRRLDADLPWLGVTLMVLSYVAFKESIGGGLLVAVFVSSLALTILHLARRCVPWLSPRLRRVLADAVLLAPLLFV